MRASRRTRIQEFLEELEVVSHSDEEQECLNEAIRAANQQTQNGRTHSGLPSRASSRR
jgi:hypothetical protein